ncbi:MAG: ABC transporter permease, partial [Pseudomonadota bacterium]
MILESAWRNLIRQKQRSAASLTAVAFSIVALLGATGFNSALFKEFREATIHSETGHLQISRTGFQTDGRSDPSSYLLEPEPPVDVDQLSVTAVLAPRLLVNGLVSYGDRTQPFIAQGADPAVDMSDDRGLRISDGRRLRADDHRQVILGSELSSTLGVAVGSSVVLLVNTTDGQLSAAEAEVVGLFEAFSKEFENSALVMPLM